MWYRSSYDGMVPSDGSPSPSSCRQPILNSPAGGLFLRHHRAGRPGRLRTDELKAPLHSRPPFCFKAHGLRTEEQAFSRQATSRARRRTASQICRRVSGLRSTIEHIPDHRGSLLTPHRSFFPTSRTFTKDRSRRPCSRFRHTTGSSTRRDSSTAVDGSPE